MAETKLRTTLELDWTIGVRPAAAGMKHFILLV
jgi:hypothetical protein